VPALRTHAGALSVPLLSFAGVSIAFGRDPLLEDAAFAIDAGERVCLIGRNGAGKSTLLRIVAGELVPDGGDVWRAPALRIARLSQELDLPEGATVFDAVAGGLPKAGALLAAYHHATHDAAADPALLARVGELQHQIEAEDAWRLQERVEQVLARLGLPGDTEIGALSGGWKRRTALARALVSDPDLLLLDEPTNHLDVEVTEWLEDAIAELRGGVLFVTHDRAFLARLATRIVELDRGALTSWPGDYATFLAKKAALLADEERHRALFDKKLAQEEAWIRQGIKARRTRNEGRVRALEGLREERRRRRDQPGRAKLAIEEAERSGKLVVEAADVSFAWGEKPIVRGLSLRILRGDRVGLIGPNGAGKTTLLRILLGEQAPDTGTVRLGTKLSVAYFDQLREQLDPEKTVIESVAGGSEHIEIGGQRRHVLGLLQDFLFSPERARSPVRSLSGGERNRLLLARLFTKPANLLVLDEPTNDLDIETLELLEERLAEFEGTVLLVSHDRAFLDRVVTSTIAFEGPGEVYEYVGGYTDWLRQRRTRAAPPALAAKKPAPAAAPRPARAKRSFKEQRELDSLPARIEALETEERELTDRQGRPEFYKEPPAEQSRVRARATEVAAELASAYARWEALEGSG
jgi:ABC transport system ATP-binding/permease protein